MRVPAVSRRIVVRAAGVCRKIRSAELQNPLDPDAA
jgi:hypothetical protein